ncbi:hypothetical protein [Halalkalicoccus salilacus]|uniref:hypothetical protein n=1 Tax=Halalkalicoccus sp. GCM10025704 TaxID=3252662 RepID=UPI003618A623
MADPEKLRAQLADAGLNDIQIDTETWEMEFQSATHLWDVVVNSNPIAVALVADLSREQITEVQDILTPNSVNGPGRAAPQS